MNDLRFTIADCGLAVLPLPKGEGRGEGKGNPRNCQAAQNKPGKLNWCIPTVLNCSRHSSFRLCRRYLTALALLLSTLNPQLSTVFAQGNLTPSGTPAPTMKSLAQIKPCTPISSAPFTITAPGSYRLTTNLTVSSGAVITIATNGVTLDLNGFTLSSTATTATGYGILLGDSARDITIANGHISGSQLAYGIGKNLSAEPVNVLVSFASVSLCLYGGIDLGSGDFNVVERCTVRSVGGYGIVAATVRQSSATACGGVAINGKEVTDCVGESSGNGILAVNADSCYGTSGSMTGRGVRAMTALNCYGSSSGASAVGIEADCAENCRGDNSSSGRGILAATAQNCYGRNTSAGFGLQATVYAIGCYGSSASGTGLAAENANACRGFSESGTDLSVTHKFNMP